jgi:methyltransferase (TIGR00027 family)
VGTVVEVTDTAAAIARVRQEEGARPAFERLFEDPFAHLFRGGAAADEVSERYLSAPFFREGVRVRTRFIDDGVRDALAHGTRQILVLGAGFDCRALRLREIADRERAVAVFEIDFDEQLRTKREILEEAGVRIPTGLRFVACDLAAPAFEQPLMRNLAAAGFDAVMPACMILEGVINYLDEPAIDRGLRWLARIGAPGSRLLFNYNTFRFGVAAFAERMRKAGFTRLADHGGDELYRRYLATEPPPCGELYRVGEARIG